jgi:hypothetical protein
MATFGTTSVGTNAVAFTNPVTCRFTAPEDGTITEIQVYITNSGGDVNEPIGVAIYDDASGFPDTLLVDAGNDDQIFNTWNVVPISLPITASTVYHLAAWGVAGGVFEAGATDQMSYQTGQTQFTWPATFSPSGSLAWDISIHAVYTPAGGGPAGQPTAFRHGGIPHMGTQKLRGGTRGGPWGRTRDGLYIPQHLIRKAA